MNPYPFLALYHFIVPFIYFTPLQTTCSLVCYKRTQTISSKSSNNLEPLEPCLLFLCQNMYFLIF
jgi:hypothetical protein